MTRSYNLYNDDLLKLKIPLKDVVGSASFEPVQAPFAAPFFFVPEPGGERVRPVIDGSVLNKITIEDECPLPRIQEPIHKLRKAVWSSKQDLQREYHQVETAKEDRLRTALECR